MGARFLIDGAWKREGFHKSCGVLLELEVLVMLSDNLVKAMLLRKMVCDSEFIKAIFEVYF